MTLRDALLRNASGGEAEAAQVAALRAEGVVVVERVAAEADAILGHRLRACAACAPGEDARRDLEGDRHVGDRPAAL